MDVSVSGTIDQKTYLKKFRGGFSPLTPPGSAYDHPRIRFWDNGMTDIAEGENAKGCSLYTTLKTLKVWKTRLAAHKS